MTEDKIKEYRDIRVKEETIATEKDLKILKLELLNEISKSKSYLMTRLGSMLLGGFTILGILGWIK